MVPASSGNTGDTFPAILINDVKPANLSLFTQFIFEKIIAPHMIPVLRTQPDTTAVVQPKLTSPRIMYIALELEKMIK